MSNPATILAYTSEDGRYDYVRLAAVAKAKESNATLILYDIDSAGVWGEEPLPTWISADGEEEQVPNRLAPEDLERAGRETVARQVADARAEGVDAYGWLTGSKGAGRLAEYAEKERVDLVMLPDDLGDPGLFQSLRGESVDAIKDKTKLPVIVVDHRGATVPG